MGIRAVYQEPKILIPPKWYTDITYVRVSGGFCYTVLIMDAYSKKILSINHSKTLDRRFCIEAAEEAIRKYECPEIIHADKGKQFLSKDFLMAFRDKNGKEISKASFGRKGFRNNIYVERFWRTCKYECLYLREISSPKDVKEVSRNWIEYYNREKLYQALRYRTPDEVYYGKEVLTNDGGIVMQKQDSISVCW